MKFDDLLKGDFKRFDPSPLKLSANSHILVTGAGGSIGSEISRQILLSEPKKLYLLDSSEISLFTIDNSLKKLASSKGLKTIIQPLLINLTDRLLLEYELKNIEFDYVFHSAAYKHVNLLQTNKLAALRNNLLGTNNLIEVIEKKSKNFILISTDKAVEPINIMGKTKQLCEQLLLSFSKKKSGCNFNVVRFGNVLHSSGSVIPIFKNQIENKEPLTVTDPEATRYFMTIPEAVSLVIGAATIGSNSSIYVLDMGEPIKILDLALHMIKLSGFSPTYNEPEENEIKIEFIGIRDGEKIDESLTVGTLLESSIEGIRIANEKETETSLVTDLIRKLLQHDIQPADLEEILSGISYDR